MLLLSLTSCHTVLLVDSPFVPPLVAVPGSDLAFYELSGTTSVDVVESLIDHAPGDAGVYHAALTAWAVDWRYPLASDDGSVCDLAEVDVHMHVETRFPRWEYPPQASPEDVQEWNRYSVALAAHEAEHVRLIHDRVDTLVGAIQSGHCETADTRGHAVLDEIRAVNAAYDSETLNGALTGAELAWVR